VPVRRSLLRPALLTAAILALLAVVALASRADRPARPADPEARALPLAFWDYFVTLGLLAVIGVLFLAVYLKVPLPRRADRGGRFFLIQLLTLAILAGLLSFASTRIEWPTLTAPEGAEDVFVGERPETATTQQTESGQDDSRRPLRFRWEVFLVAGGLLLLAGGMYIAGRRGGRWRQPGARSDAAARLSTALEESVDDLRAEGDPRRAVIAAYARMERTLERHGLRRHAYEAPLEYLARVLRELRVRSSAVLALTELFERAKFSRHEIDGEMKEEAIGALIAVRDDLRAGAGT
jgi:Domain of unknown function (DUF4129)